MLIASPLRRVLLVLFAAMIALGGSSALAGTGNVNFFLGTKSLEEDDWSPVEEHGEFGAEVSFGGSDWPISIAIDIFGSSAEESAGPIDFEGTTSELCVGVRKIWTAGPVRPYIGGGLALIAAELEGEQSGITVGDDDNAAGLWVGGGVFWRLGSRFNLGVAARFSAAEVELFGVEGEAGGLHLGALLGWGWPASR